MRFVFNLELLYFICSHCKFHRKDKISFMSPARDQSARVHKPGFSGVFLAQTHRYVFKKIAS